MLLFSLLIAITLKQLWKSSNPLQYDAWLITLDTQLSHWLHKIDINDTTINFSIVISLASIATFAVSSTLHQYNHFLYIVFSCAVLLYSFGRGELTRHITDFIVAEAKGDWHQACLAAQAIQTPASSIEPNHWAKLNKSFLSQANYQGFERFFAVVFWFALFGPVGAICYRLCHLWLQQVVPRSAHTNTKTHREFTRLIAIIEWPAVRVLGLTYAVTGNFTSCMHAWKQSNTKNISNQDVLLQSLEGALAVDHDIPQTQEITRRELEALQQLQTRTLWFWVGCIAIVFIL
ncbi:regulatory signaling modulator protein AmpE [Marinagarivorans algicola]|uniref:regulatory signaling modulator protein AmpE n=1 Tax=Marinagarivorans algicola TaxID=1513270 RepID=UPI0006B8C43A|nr:regulatory signaling modulator protein AmpE [Marinagarivorans algicola]